MDARWVPALAPTEGEASDREEDLEEDEDKAGGFEEEESTTTTTGKLEGEMVR